MTTPHLAHTTAELAELRRPGSTRAVVMTMGALHRGHAALVAAARREAGPGGQVVVTVFVNPLQFGPGEDFDRYPRTLPDDLRIAGEAGADVVFAPAGDEVYPDGTPLVTLAAGPMGDRLEGAHRPGHFDGVLTVVAKLLHLTDPDVAFFGEKDAQQLALIRRMVRDLDFPVRVVGVATVREGDGLALSSRNRYLSPAERGTALALSRALFAARDRLVAEAALRARAREAPTPGPGLAEALAALDQEEASADARAMAHATREPDPAGSALAAAGTVLREAARLDPPLETDYLALIDPGTFTEITPGDPAPPGPAVLAVAARVGATRLIDNVQLDLGTAP